MTLAEIFAVGFLALMVVLILRGLRGHRRSGDGSGAGDGLDSGPGDGGD